MRPIVLTCIILFVLSGLVRGQEDTIIHANGAALHYQTFGSGPAMVIINGGPGMNSEGFIGVAQLLGNDYQTIIYDQRGTGQSTLPITDETTITMDLMVQDIEALRKHLGFDQWVVLGHSFGGILASYYATRHPEFIRGMVLSSSGGIDLDLLDYFSDSLFAKLTPGEQQSLSYWNTRINQGDTSYNARLQRGLAMAPAYVYHKEHIPAIGERMTQGNMAINGLVWNNLQRIGFDCSDQLRSFDQPVLIIQGKQDIISKETAEKAHAVLPNSEIIFLDKCGHYGWLDQPDLYYRAIRDYLSKLNK